MFLLFLALMTIYGSDHSESFSSEDESLDCSVDIMYHDVEDNVDDQSRGDKIAEDPSYWSLDQLEKGIADVKEHIKTQERCIDHINTIKKYNNGYYCQLEQHYNTYLSDNTKDNEAIQKLSKELEDFKIQIRDYGARNRTHQFRFAMDERRRDETAHKLEVFKKELKRTQFWLEKYDGIESGLLDEYFRLKERLRKENEVGIEMEKKRCWYERKLADMIGEAELKELKKRIDNHIHDQFERTVHTYSKIPQAETRRVAFADHVNRKGPEVIVDRDTVNFDQGGHFLPGINQGNHLVSRMSAGHSNRNASFRFERGNYQELPFVPKPPKTKQDTNGIRRFYRKMKNILR